MCEPELKNIIDNDLYDKIVSKIEMSHAEI